MGKATSLPGLYEYNFDFSGVELLERDAPIRCTKPTGEVCRAKWTTPDYAQGRPSDGRQMSKQELTFHIKEVNKLFKKIQEHDAKIQTIKESSKNLLIESNCFASMLGLHQFIRQQEEEG